MVHAPHVPPPTLAPIQPQYDISPPGTRPEILGHLKVIANSSPAMDSVETEPAESKPIISNAAIYEETTSGSVGASQGGVADGRPESSYTGSEEQIAALGLAALDGAQDEDEESAVKAEAQGAPDLDAVPPSKPASRPHKASTSKPSEGSSDKRFLCYICVKLFTRRRSVRDHIKKIHNDTNFDVARAIEVIVDPETGESLIPLADLVKTLAPSSGVQQPQITASRSASRASSVETNTFSTPAPLAGKKRPAPEMAPAQTTASKKKGTAKSKPVNTISAKKVKPEIDSPAEAAIAFRSLSGTPVSGRATKPPPPLISKLRKQPSMSLACSPTPSDRISIAPATDNEAEDEREQDYVPAEAREKSEAGDENEDENEVFCICRKGDNHTWMIGCDGGCEDWFHGKCVNIQERDGDLIDKYICPACEDRGQGQTTWKRMCRRKECRKPARVLADPPSKYCTDECKKRFWVGMIQRSDPNAIVSEDGLMVIGSKADSRNREKTKKKPKRAKEDEEYNETNNDEESDYREGGSVKLSPSRKKKKKKTATSPTTNKSRKSEYLGEDANSSDDEDVPLATRGGSLSVGDIKMMLNQAKTVEEIRQLGQKPPTPPYTSDVDVDIDKTDIKKVNGTAHTDSPQEREPEAKPFPYNPEELSHLSKLSAKKRHLNAQLQLLRDQEKFFAMLKTRSAALIEEMDVPKKAKNVCGFDARLAWSIAEFEEWRDSAAGRMALVEGGGVGDPDPSHDAGKEETGEGGLGEHDLGQEEEDDDDGDGDQGDEGTKRSSSSTILRGICIRNKCPRHREWKRLLASEYKFEEEGVRRQMRKVDAEGKEVRERAAMRVLCEQE